MSFNWNPDNDKNMGEHDRIWDKFFMGIALLCGKRSKDDITQVGACVVNDEPRVIGTGYNGMPIGCRDRLMPWNETDEEGNKRKHDYVCHAELNAIVNMDPISVSRCTLYVTLFPCNECAKIVAKSGIKRVIYLSDEKKDKVEFKAGRHILKNEGITVESFLDHCDGEKVTLKFRENEEDGDQNGPESAKKLKTHDPTGRKVISWEQFFMGLAKLSAEVRSVNEAKEGACVVNPDKRIVGLGYVDDSLLRKVEDPVGGRELYVSHAPVNAIVTKSPNSLRGCTMYVTHFPCNECARVIVQSGIKKVVYLERFDLKRGEGGRKAAIRMFDIAHVELEEYEAKDKRQEIHLDFTASETKLS